MSIFKPPFFQFQRHHIIDRIFSSKTSKMSEQEFTVRIPPRNEKKNYHIMKFNANLKVDVGKWSQVCTNT